MSTTSRRRKKGGIPPIVPVAVAVVAGLGLFAVILTSGGGSTADVEVSGEPLPPYQDGAPEDEAVGESAPTVVGEDFDGSEVTIDYDGDPTVVIFLTHWCPACQREAPQVQDVIDDGGLPDDVDLVTVSTASERNADNYPPDDWLESLGWEPPIVVDDDDDSVAQAFGLTIYPFWVVLDGDGTVVSRHGLLDEQGIRQLFAELSDEEAARAEPATPRVRADAAEG